MSMKDFLKKPAPAPAPDDITTEFVFDKYAVSKEIMKAAKGKKLLAPEEVTMRNVETLNHWLEVWGLNMMLNAPMIMKDYGVTEHVRRPTKAAGVESANLLQDVARPDLCILAGSGPSLDDYLPLMKSWPGIIICAATNVLSFLAHGITPHYVLAVDANPELRVYLENAAAAPGAENISLILPITADPETASCWPHRRYWYLDFIQGGNDLNNPWNSFQCMIYPFVGGYLVQAGSVVNCAFMLPILWGRAGLFDVKKVFLFGVECGFPREYTHGRVRRWKWDTIHREWDCYDPRPVDSVRSSPLAESASGIPTEAAQLGYKRSLATIWYTMHYRGEDQGPDEKVFTREFSEEDRKPGMFHLYSCSHGILEDTIPHLDGKRVLSGYADDVTPYTRADVDRLYTNYIKHIAPREGQGEDLASEEETVK